MNFVRSFRFLASVLVGVGALHALSANPQNEQAASRAPSGSTAAGKVDLNSADVKTLAAIPEIGPELARAIVAARPFASMDELNRVKGITVERLKQIRAKAFVAPSSNAASNVREMIAGKASHEPARTSGGEPGKVDLNNADLKTLEAMPGIGPEAARAIIAARPFTTLDDLSRVQGISAEQLEQIRAVATVATTSPAPAKKGDGRQKQEKP